MAVALVERHAIVRAALRAMLETAPGARVVAATERWTPASARASVLVLSVDGPGDLETFAAGGYRAERPRLIVLGDDEPEWLPRQSALAGASGFVSKREPPATLFKAIARVHLGEVWFDGATMATLITEAAGLHPVVRPDRAERALEALSPTEREIVAAVTEGLKNREIAERFGTSEPAVRHALTRIYRALGVEGRMGLARLGLRSGISAGGPESA